MSWSTTPCLRVWVTEKSRAGSEVVMPNWAASDTDRKTEAVSSSSLAGMQPRCRQVPPTLAISTMAMSSPRPAP